MGFVFYGIATTGTDKSFDQLLQFAAIHTDADLNILGRFERQCRLLPHIVPAPEMLTTIGLPMERVLASHLPTHYSVVCEIAAQLTAWSPAIFLGWGSLDADEYLRQALYQCLHPPYLTNAPGSGRCDLRKLAQALLALQPDTLSSAYDAYGQLTFGLTEVARANGVAHPNPGDALADVEVTVQLCRRIFDRAPDHWSTMLRFAQKATAVAFTDEASAFVATECYFEMPYRYALTKLGVDSQMPATMLGYDLEVDPAELRVLSDEQLRLRLDQKVKPIRRVRLNAAPVLHDVYDLGDFRGIPAEQWAARGEDIRADTTLCARLCRAAERPPYPPSTYVEQQMHGTFSNNADKARMVRFHAGDWQSRAAMLETFEDVRLIELGYRLIFHHAPELLPFPRRQEVARQLACRMLGHGYTETPWLTLGAAHARARALGADCSPTHHYILTGLLNYVAQEHQRYSALLN
ncbi:hypothetical protein NDN01_20375 [Sphingomonas sp. QA11]|uniref:hypothetical protein n=1 Tax=Sphingomonas sp. QA11 TaxID=2950605 RepID=UPI00234B567A|nr:hypothetical protein [Sphingomonas sp. QA11]WCM26338.1 hypothetical protein NDN01_20375 [Sphingomonas sp. QA11]